MKSKIPFLLILILSLFNSTGAQNINLFAGSYSTGYSGDGGPAALAQLAWATDVASDNGGNIYIADHDNDVIRIVNSAGIISTFAGNHTLGYSGDGGPASLAQLYHPAVITLDNTGNIYFTDQNAEVIRKINTAGIITTITGNLPIGYSGDGGPLILAQFQSISGLTFDNAGNLYIADFGNSVIRKVNTSGIITTIAGNGTAGFSGDGGPATSAQLDRPYGVVLDGLGNIYIPDAGNNKIRKINTAGIISTYAGNGIAGYSGDGGPASLASLYFPWHSTIDKMGNLYIVDPGNYVVRKITPAGIISTFAGNTIEGCAGDGGPAINAEMDDPCGIAVDSADNVYIVCRTPCYTVRRINNCLSPIINQQPVNAALCNTGDTSFILNATNASSYQWQVNSGSGWNNISDDIVYTGSNTNNLQITGANSGMNGYQYRCFVNNSCGGIYSLITSLVVTTAATPTIAISTPSLNICQGTIATFTATITNGGLSPIFQWTKNGLPVGTNSNTYIENSLNNGDIIICNLVSNSTCVTTNLATSNSIIMTVNPLLTPSITITASTNNICASTPITFSSTISNGGSSPSYQWQKNGINVGNNSPTYTDASLNNGDLITAILNSNYNCVTSTIATSNTVQVNVTALLTPSIIINSSATSICPGSTTIVYSANQTNGGASPVYQWKKNGILVGINANTYSDNSINNGDIITCTLVSNAVCLVNPVAISNSIVMNVFQKPIVILDQSPTLCANSTRQLDAGNFKTYLWNNGETTRTILVNSVGLYYVTVTDNNGCNGSDTTTITTILPSPSGFLGTDTAICSYGTLLLQPTANYKSYLWSTNSINRSITIANPGTYWLQVSDNNNCLGIDTIIVLPKECMKGFYIPNAFTPNGDGKNDIFRPLLFGRVQYYHFWIYNRWGQLIFETTDLSKGWDGKFLNTPQKNDVFVWMCKFQFEGEEMRTEKGTVMVIR